MYSNRSSSEIVLFAKTIIAGPEDGRAKQIIERKVSNNYDIFLIFLRSYIVCVFVNIPNVAHGFVVFVCVIAMARNILRTVCD